MVNKSYFMKNKARITLAIAFFTLSGFAGWQWHEKQYPSWKEEVQLSDGRIITIIQKRKYFDGYGTDQSWVTLSLPEMGGEQVWHSYTMPMKIDVHQGSVYVFGLPRGPKQASYYRYPKYLIVAFRWNGSGFERVPFTQVPLALRSEENIYRCIPLEGRYVSLIYKKKHWCPPDGDKGQFTKSINIKAYEEAGNAVSKLSGGSPLSE